MKKFLHVVVHEYTRHVFRKRFLFGLLSIPLVGVIMILIVFLLILTERPKQPIGYVDHSGLLTDTILPSKGYIFSARVELVPFESESQADEALLNRQIEAYYVLEADYLQTSQARLISREKPSSLAHEKFEALVRTNLLSDQSPAVAQRLTEGDELTVRTSEGSRQVGGGGWSSVLVPAFAGLAFMLATFTTSGYLIQAIAEEKENRTMEVLITSISPPKLIIGKTTGLIGVGLTQLFVWTSPAIILALIRPGTLLDLLPESASLTTLGLLVAALIPAFLTIAALMAAVGATVADEREGQQIAGLFSIIILMPIWFLIPIMDNPNGFLATMLSFFPLTAPLTLSLRVALTSVPIWQMILNVCILVLSAIFATWLAGHTFHLGMLQYGQRLSWRKVFTRRGEPQ